MSQKTVRISAGYSDKTSENYNSTSYSINTSKFEKAGWEGDGVIRFFVVPNFILYSTPNGSEYPSTCGEYGFLVKQGNNGTTYICVEKGLIPEK